MHIKYWSCMVVLFQLVQQQLFAMGQLLGFNFTNIVVSLYHFNIDVFSKASVDLTGRKMVWLTSTIEH